MAHVMHVRAVVADDRLDAVLGLVRAERSVCNLVVLRHAVERPQGSLVEFDLPIEVANAMITDLKRLGVDHDGGITASRVDVTVSDVADRAAHLAPGDPGDAVVWAEVSARTSADGRLTLSFVALMLLAVLIAAVGILTDSVVLIVGAMVLGPEFGPMSDIAYGVHRRKPWRIVEGLRTLLVGFGLAIAVTFLTAAFIDAIGAVPAAYEGGARPLTEFIAHPDGFAVLVAVLAGIAGTVSLLESKSTGLVGVFISVTTVPAAANVGVALALGQIDEAQGALIQLVVNITCIVVSAAVTMTVVRSAWHRARRKRLLEAAARAGDPLAPPP